MPNDLVILYIFIHLYNVCAYGVARSTVLSIMKNEILSLMFYFFGFFSMPSLRMI